TGDRQNMGWGCRARQAQGAPDEVQELGVLPSSYARSAAAPSLRETSTVLWTSYGRILARLRLRLTSCCQAQTERHLQRVAEGILHIQPLHQDQRRRGQGGGQRQAQAAREYRHQHLWGGGEGGRESHCPLFDERREHIALKPLHPQVEQQDRQRPRDTLG